MFPWVVTAKSPARVVEPHESALLLISFTKIACGAVEEHNSDLLNVGKRNAQRRSCRHSILNAQREFVPVVSLKTMFVIALVLGGVNDCVWLVLSITEIAEPEPGSTTTLSLPVPLSSNVPLPAIQLMALSAGIHRFSRRSKERFTGRRPRDRR